MTQEEFGRPDFRLVGGFRFRCVPGCGLCCYATPAVTPAERERLIQLDPDTPLLDTSEGWSQIASRSSGGACYFLRGERCRCHPIRPATCGEFPLTTYVSERVQVSVVLTCPGVDLAGLGNFATGSHRSGISTSLSSEVEFVNREVRSAAERGRLRWASRRRQAVERRLRTRGGWQPEEEIRLHLRRQVDRWIPTDLPPADGPTEAEALETLPMFYDPAFGRVAWRVHSAGMEFFTLHEEGGKARELEVLDTPNRSPGFDPAGQALLRGYLAYLLERDATVGAAYDYLLDAEPQLPELVVVDYLQQAAGQVVRMACLRRALTSDHRGPLTEFDIENGIRATDMDVLDRPTIGLTL